MAATIDEILDALSDNADFEEVGSVARARSFITAARRFLSLPSSQSDQGSSLGYTPQVVQQEMAIMKKLDHPHIVKLYEIIDDPKEKKLYLITEFVKKGNLEKKVK